jgi:hypothetical protein
MHSVPRYSRPDLGVKKLSKLPCYNALLSRNPLIYHISLVSPAIFPAFSLPGRENAGCCLPAQFKLRGGIQTIRSHARGLYA